MKSYTDIEQSKKLAEILPLESADMLYWVGEYITHPYMEGQHKDEQIPVWSLAALYSILPNNKKETTTLSRGGWKIEPAEYLDAWWCEYENEESHTNDLSMSADNPVDACYEMIIKLHELNLL